MTLTEIVAEAERKLPYTTEFEYPIIRIPVEKEIELDINSLLDTPTQYDHPFHIIQFRKQIIKGIVIGWEFVCLENGI